MAYKQTTAAGKSGASVNSLTGLLARLKNAIVNLVPMGYEDETGFHFGAEPRKNHTRGHVAQ